MSAASAVLSVTIVTPATTPSVPDLATASDSGASSTDNVTNITTPIFTGTATAGTVVTLYDGAVVIGTATATGGSWSITAPKLADGIHSITATATDAAGNVSAPSAALGVTIDTVAPTMPAAPDLTAVSDSGVSNTDNITNVKTPTFAGTAEAGSTVSLYDGTKLIGTGTAATAGTWSITSTSVLADGVHSITANTTDVAGNVGTASAALSVTIDSGGTHRAIDSDACAGLGQRRLDHRQYHQHRHAHLQGHRGGEQHGDALRRLCRYRH